MSTILELRSVSKQFATHQAVDQVSFRLAQGEFFSLVGPSGCGKTTTLRMIAGLEELTSGSILLNGRPVQNLPPYQRNVSTVFQNYALFPHLTVLGNVEFGFKHRRMAGSAEKVREVLSLLQLAGKEERYPQQLSGGEKQRVALARSLVLQPDVLLLDEPLSALDPQLRRQVRLELKALQKRSGITFLLVTHDQEEALSLSDRLAVMNTGRLLQIGPPESLYRQPKSRFVAEFLGDMNWFGEIGVRPENLHVSMEPPPTAIAWQRATVEGATFLGNRTRLSLYLPNSGRAVAETDGSISLRDSPYVWWHAADEVRIHADK